MNQEQRSRLNGIILTWVIILGLIILFFSSCVRKVVPVSSKPIPVTTIVVRPDSTKTYSTIMIKYFDTVAIYLNSPKQKQ